MNTPFPGMDPWLEHPSLWEGFHSRLIVAIANLLQPALDPRYVASVEERVFIEVEMLEVRQKFVEILDAYNNMKLVTLVEVLSPSNKRTGPGQQSYVKKQEEVLERDCHLIEIDLLRHGERVVSLPAWKLSQLEAFDYVACVSRWPRRTQFELYPRRLEEKLPRVAIPLNAPDPDVALDVQAAVAQVYSEGRYARRLKYDHDCEPPLSDDRQRWASQLLTAAGLKSN